MLRYLFVMGFSLMNIHPAHAHQIPGLNPIRRLLCHIRGGDYVHPGDADAIDLVVNQALEIDPLLKSKPMLDVGCGFGGTVHYIAQKGFSKTCGLDFDQAAIAYAQATYSPYLFIPANALHADQYFPENSFGFITLFSVIFAIDDKRTLLNTLSKLAQPGAILAIWDFTHPNSVD